MIIRLLAIVLLCASTDQSATAAGLTKEYSVKLAFLYKFANYVENTKAGNRNQVTIGILGPDPFGATLDAVAAKRKARGKTLRIARFEDADDYSACDILFVSSQCTDIQINRIVELTRGDGVLIVGEQPQFTNRGGTMNFYIDANGKTAIQLNVDAAQARQLRIDARLMRVCDIVQAGGNSP